ncbi:MAG: TlpA family protein disulfide reductase, partial [bacterium]|nr:TlpA family protein disulfide reductase [bacterium]
DIAGNKVNLYGYKDKVVLLDFWATWCGPCRKEIPTLVDIKKTYGDAGFEIVSIALERGNDAGAKKFVKENKMNWVHIINEKTGREIAQKYEIQYIPTMYLIKNGKILATGLRGEALKTKIKELLGK